MLNLGWASPALVGYGFSLIFVDFTVVSGGDPPSTLDCASEPGERPRAA
jgi:hypothetical protein